MAPHPSPLWHHEFDGWSWSHFDLGDAQLGAYLEHLLDDDIAAALTSPESRPRCSAHADGVLLNLRGVNLNAGADPEDMVSLRLWIGPDRVVTTRFRRVLTVLALHERAIKGEMFEAPRGLLLAICQGLVQRIETVSLSLEERVDDLEEQHLEGQSVNPRTLLELRQMLIKLRRFLGPQREALEELADLTASDPEYATAQREVALRMARTLEALDAARDRLAVLGEHLLSEENARQGRNSYVLGIMAAIFLPLGFLTGLFGVNVGGMPGVDNEGGFALITGASVAIGVALFALFKWLRWL